MSIKVVDLLEPFILATELGIKPVPVIVMVFVPTPIVLALGLIELMTGFGLFSRTGAGLP